MGGPLDTWRVHGWFDDVEIEVDPGGVDLDAMQTSITELTKLLEGVGYPSEAREPLLEIHARLQGFPWIAQSREMATFDLGSPHVRILVDDLLLAARMGRLVVRRFARPRLPPTRSELPISKLRPIPPSPPQPQKSWIGVALIDQNGKPVPTHGYRIVAPDGAVHQDSLGADGTAKVKDIEDGACRVSCPYMPARGSVTYTVQPGDHISGIAQTYGFDDYTLVWNDPNNADLQSQRDDPHVLAPGDEVFIPAIRDAPVSKPTGDQHTFQIQVSPLKLRIKLLDFDADPVAGAVVTIDGQTLTADGDGIVEIPVDKLQDASTLSIDGTDFDVSIGSLDPLDDDTQAGWKARLFNLGFLDDPTLPDDHPEVVFALSDFQVEFSLDVSGTFDDATKSKLRDVYGC